MRIPLVLAAALASYAHASTDRFELPPLLKAVFKGSETEAVALIESKTDVNVKSPQGLTALMYAAIAGRDALSKRLLNAGADPKARDENGANALNHAVMRKQTSLSHIRTLIEAGADVDNRGIPHGSTPLHNAAAACRPDVVQALLDAGALVDARQTKTGATPLMLAILNYCSSAVKVLLNGKADASLPDARGRTAANLARESRHSEITALLAAAEKRERR